METDRDSFLATVTELLLDAICVVDKQGIFVFVSAAGERIFGYAPQEMIGRPMIDFVVPEDRERTLRAAEGIVAGYLQHDFENRYLRKDGSIVHIMWSARWSEADQVRVAVARDVTERRRAEYRQAALYAVSEAAHSVEGLDDLFSRVHKIIDGLLPAGNFFVALYDQAKEELSFPYFVDEHYQAPASVGLDSDALSAEVIRTGAALLLTPDTRASLRGDVRLDVGRDSVNWLGVPLTAARGVIGALVVQSYSKDVKYGGEDVELLQFVSAQVATAVERKQMELRLQHMALHDPLTDLPNRELFHDRLQTALLYAKRHGTSLALLYLDLDDFKQINDTFGHPAGDLLLQEVGNRLTQCVRASDTVGRIGGDEFLLLLNSIHHPDNASAVAEKVRAALAQPIDLAGRRVCVTPSIGIARYPEHGSDYEELIRYADAAMYSAKRGGGNRAQTALASTDFDAQG